MEYREFGKTGLRLSVMGFGGATLGSVFRKIDEEEGKRAVAAAIDHGINYIDTAPFYGITRSETVLGEALKGRRQRIILATKLGRYGDDEFDFSAERVRTSIEESLRRLQTDYVDLLVAHDVEFGDLRQVAEETLPAMRELKRQGKCRFIGYSGYPLPTLARLLEWDQVEVDFVLSYCHYCLYNTALVEKLAPVARARGLGLINASPLAMGLLTQEGPPAWHPAPQVLQDAARRAAQVCRKRGAELSFIGLQFALDNPAVTSTLSGIENREQLEKNLATLAAPIDQDLWQELQAIFKPVRNLAWPSGRPENN